MSYLKKLGLAAVAAMAMAAFTASSAPATTLEVGGVTQNSAVPFTWSLEEAGFIWRRTDGTLANTCTSSTVGGASESPFTGTKVTGAISTLSWTNCSAGSPTVHQKGQLYIEHESGTTNGNVFWENTEVTVPTALGFTVNCKTGSGTKVGTVKGASSGHATIEFHAVFNCGFLLPSATAFARYIWTSPTGTGVSA